MENLPEKKVHEGTVVGRPDRQHFPIQMVVTGDRRGVWCRVCDVLVSDDPFDVERPMNAHVIEVHSS